MSFSKHTFAFVIGASLEELERFVALRPNESADDEILQYAQAISFYLKGDLEALKEIDKSLRARETFVRPAFLWALSLRIGIRERLVSQDFCRELAATLENIDLEPEWKGELYFLLGMSAELRARTLESQNFYQRAYETLIDVCPPKALKSRMNALVAHSRLFPKSRLIPSYVHLANEAKKAGCLIVAGLCCLNLSREFQKLFAYELAYDYVQQSLAQLKADYGSVHYYHALLHRCHVFIDLGQFHLARKDFQESLEAPFAEIQEVRSFLQQRIESGKKQLSPLQPDIATPTWRERWEKLLEPKSKNSTTLAPSERAILELLANGPRTKHELMSDLYGDEINFFDAENRLKVTLSRLRKKCPDSVIFNKNRYELSEPGALFYVV